MTFEKILEVFHYYLKEDTICEVILTQRGYTVMFWVNVKEIGSA
ncbi:MAG: hypothetical protein R3Y63_12230 [Eubacteriales bacterium]